MATAYTIIIKVLLKSSVTAISYRITLRSLIFVQLKKNNLPLVQIYWTYGLLLILNSDRKVGEQQTEKKMGRKHFLSTVYL